LSDLIQQIRHAQVRAGEDAVMQNLQRQGLATGVTSATAETLDVEDGKYTLVRDGGKLEALRYGEKWRDLTGDKFVSALGQEIKRLRAVVDEVHRWVVCGCIAPPEDMAGNFERIAAITASGASVEDTTPKYPFPTGTTAVLTLHIESTAGYVGDTTYPRVHPDQWGQVIAALEGTLKEAS
jgi:hypothetical protein